MASYRPAGGMKKACAGALSFTCEEGARPRGSAAVAPHRSRSGYHLLGILGFARPLYLRFAAGTLAIKLGPS